MIPALIEPRLVVEMRPVRAITKRKRVANIS